MGLTVLLDAHTDLVGEYSLHSDFEGFTAIVIPPGDFPLTQLNAFGIKPGYNNRVSLSAIKLTAEMDVESIDPRKRNCYFPHEIQYIKLHQKYSQTNCLLECSLFFAQKQLQQVSISPTFYEQLLRMQ
jgi:hypothetical protein